jgi:hypothetical protein
MFRLPAVPSPRASLHGDRRTTLGQSRILDHWSMV